MRNHPSIVDARNLFVAFGVFIGLLLLIGCGSSTSSSTPQTFTVGGSVSGLTGTGLVLQNNGGNNLAVSANGAFTFTTALASGAAYSVMVSSQPSSPSQTCAVASGSGTVTANVNNVSVTCTTDTFTIGGTVSRLIGSELKLQDNGGDDLTVSANGAFTFPTALASGSNFVVTVLTQPSNPIQQICGVTNGSGVVTTANITAVDVACVTTTTFLSVPDYDNNRVLIYKVPFITGQGADVVLGQADFTTATSGTTASTMDGPSAVAVDRAGNLYVGENVNCRVTQFRPPFSNGMSASVVFGQPDFSASDCPTTTTAASLGNPTAGDHIYGAAVDTSGDLWVADNGSNRVVEYVLPFSNGMAATLAIGQTNLTSGSPNQGGVTPTSSTLTDPGFPTFDPSGNLWIADFGNNRLLEFRPPFSTGMTASLVLGQPNFTGNTYNQGGAPGANTLYEPEAVAFDASGNMWVVDLNNNRVLEFTPPFTNNMNASLVLGQADFTHNSPNRGGTATGATLQEPFQVAFDGDGKLFVSDSGNNRTLVFTPPFSNGMDASLVIGQAGFTSNTAATTPAGQNFPVGVTTAPPLY
jgi:hypothetical protein